MKFGVSVFCQNYSDWPRYLSGDFSKPALQPDHEVVLEDLELADMSESLGYDALWATRFGRRSPWVFRALPCIWDRVCPPMRCRPLPRAPSWPDGVSRK